MQLKANDFHFGYSSNPNIEKFLDLEFVDLDNPFWMGYYTHLIIDKVIYDPDNDCIDFEKFQREGCSKTLLHRDWDIANQIFEEEYGIELLPEIEALNIVQYVHDEEPRYINVQEIMDYVEIMRNILI